MPTIHTGGCQCGRIRFRTDVLIDNAHICHCRMCQKATGNYFAPLVGTPKARLVWTRGTPARFASSAGVARGFCADCGTPLYFDPLTSADIALMIGAFDAPARIALRTQDSVESRVPLFHHLPSLPEAGTSEQAQGAAAIAAIAASNRQHPDHDTAAWPPA